MVRQGKIHPSSTGVGISMMEELDLADRMVLQTGQARRNDGAEDRTPSAQAASPGKRSMHGKSGSRGRNGVAGEGGDSTGRTTGKQSRELVDGSLRGQIVDVCSYCIIACGIFIIAHSRNASLSPNTLSAPFSCLADAFEARKHRRCVVIS